MKEANRPVAAGSVTVGDLLADKYRVERVLGQGGMGRVVAAVHEGLARRVAIKLLLPRALDATDAKKRFVREARAAAVLKTQHVGRVLDVGTLASGEPYMVMEYLDGHDLAAEIDRAGSLVPAVAVDYMLQACEAVAEAHSHNIVHRDLKPANLFLTQAADGSPLIKVLDFGIAKAAPTESGFEMTRTNTLIGSPAYMSPEQFKSPRRVDPRTDIWSLGVVLYELVSGELPFPGTTFSELCIRIATEPMTPLEAPVPPGLAAVISRCLEKGPDGRYDNVAELAAALEPFAPHRRGAAAAIARVLGVDAPASALPRQASGRWPVAIIAAAAALVLAAGVALIFSRGDPTVRPDAGKRLPIVVTPLVSTPVDATAPVDASVAPDATPQTADAARPRRPRQRSRRHRHHATPPRERESGGLNLDIRE